MDKYLSFFLAAPTPAVLFPFNRGFNIDFIFSLFVGKRHQFWFKELFLHLFPEAELVPLGPQACLENPMNGRLEGCSPWGR